MKHSILVIFLLVLLFSCKKESTNHHPDLLINKIKLQLKDSLLIDDYQQLNFTNTTISNFENTNTSIARIPFQNKSIKNDFVLLKIEKDQTFSKGKIIHLKQIIKDTAKAIFNFDGEISIYTLKRVPTIKSLISNGYIEAFHTTKGNVHEKPLVVPLLYIDIPDVVLAASYLPTSYGWSYADWYNIQSMLSDDNDFAQPTGGGGVSGSTSGYYVKSEPTSADVISGTGDENDGVENGGGTAQLLQIPTRIDFEPVENLQAIALKKYIECFSSIPDAGAECSIRILTDIPVDRDPTIFMDWKRGSPGHTFLQLTKINGTQTITQNIGFYPLPNWKNIFSTAPVASKFVDNADHEFNASLLMNLTPDKFQSTLVHMLYLANSIQYDVDENNCTDFALNVFNYQRGGNQLDIPMYDIPGGTAVGGTRTPEGLYQKLKEMKDKAGPESNNIIIPGVKGYVGDSHGPCN